MAQRPALPQKMVAMGLALALPLAGAAHRLFEGSAEAAPPDRTPPILVVGEDAFGPPAIDDAEPVVQTRSYKDRFNTCEEAVLTEPESYGLTESDGVLHTSRGSRRFFNLTPFVELSPVRANGRLCGDNVVRRQVEIFSKVNGRRSLLHYDGRPFFTFFRVSGNEASGVYRGFGNSKGSLCGKVVQAVVKVEADTDEIRGNELGRVFQSPEEQIKCRS